MKNLTKSRPWLLGGIEIEAAPGLHHDTLQSVNDLAGLLRLKGQFDEAGRGWEAGQDGQSDIEKKMI